MQTLKIIKNITIISTLFVCVCGGGGGGGGCGGRGAHNGSIILHALDKQR